MIAGGAAEEQSTRELARAVILHSIRAQLERSLPRTITLGERDSIAEELLADLGRDFLRPALQVFTGD